MYFRFMCTFLQHHPTQQQQLLQTYTAKTIHPPSDRPPLITIVLVRTTLCGYLSHHLRRHLRYASLHVCMVCHLHRLFSSSAKNVREETATSDDSVWGYSPSPGLRRRHWKLIPYRPSSSPVCLSHNHSCGQGLLLWPSVFGSFDLLRKEYRGWTRREGTAAAEDRLTVPNGHKSAPTNDLSYWQSFRLINALSSIARLRFKSPSSFCTMKTPRYDDNQEMESILSSARCSSSVLHICILY